MRTQFAASKWINMFKTQTSTSVVLQLLSDDILFTAVVFDSDIPLVNL